MELSFNIFLKFSAIGVDSIVKEGKKVFQSINDILEPPYSKDIPIRIEGKIVCDTIVANTFEKNTLGKEIKGALVIPLNNRYVFEGTFTGAGKNCNGLIEFSRINKKELRTQYKKFY